MSIADRYYTKAEYDKLSNPEKLGLKRKRSTRGHKRYPGNGKGGRSNGKQKKNSDTLSIDNRSIAALASMLAKTLFEETDTTENETDDSTDNKEAPKPVTYVLNRTNKALKRRKI